MNPTLQATLFPEDGENTFAVIDGASCEELLEKLEEHRPEFFCLYVGELEPDVQEVAPYLVELRADHPFTKWLLANGSGRHWGIFVRSRASLREARKHFRTFLLVKDPEGRTLYFRYYDPRVLTIYLPTTTPAERTTVFGPASAYLCEGPDDTMLVFRCRGSELEKQSFTAAAARN